jgi:hypothetical protein
MGQDMSCRHIMSLGLLDKARLGSDISALYRLLQAFVSGFARFVYFYCSPLFGQYLLVA